MAEPAPATNYTPGVCNINQRETANRRHIGYTGAVIFIIVLMVLVVISAPRVARIVLFVPAVFAASGLLQAKNKFCVGYAGAGMQNADGNDMVGKKIMDSAAARKDKDRALRINLQSLAYAAVATVLAVVV